LLFIGNAKGLIGYGLGRGTDYESAYGNAMQQAKNNLIYIEIDPQNTCPNVLKAQFNDVNLKILPMPYMRNWGNPILWSMLQYTGIRHCMFIIRNYRVNYLGLVSAYFMCMSQLLTPRKIAERDGRRIGEVYSRSMRNAELTY
jgi:ribosomal protein S5